jgi:hypothetical protein
MSVTTASSCHGILGFKSALSKPEYSSSWVFILEPRDVLVISALSSCLVIVVSRVVLSPLLQTNKERKRTPRTPCGLFFSGRHLAGTIPWLIQKTPGPSYSVHPSFYERPTRGSLEPNALPGGAQGSAHYQIRVHLHLGLHSFIPEPFCL